MGSTGPLGSTNLSCNLSHQSVGVLRTDLFFRPVIFLLGECLLLVWPIRNKQKGEKNYAGRTAHFTFSLPHLSDKLTVLRIQTADLIHLQNMLSDRSWGLLLLLNVIYSSTPLYFCFVSFYWKWTSINFQWFKKNISSVFVSVSQHCFSLTVTIIRQLTVKTLKHLGVAPLLRGTVKTNHIHSGNYLHNITSAFKVTLLSYIVAILISFKGSVPLSAGLTWTLVSLIKPLFS